MENVLIVGTIDTAVETLCKRLIREGSKVFVLSDGASDSKLKNIRRYNYEYDSDSVYEVFGSCRPDRVVFMGAYDALFTWKKKTEKRDYRKFVSGLSNVLRISEAMGVERFIYVSSEELFEDHYVRDIHEQAKPVAKSMKATALSIGEMLVRCYNENMSIDGVVARLDRMYFCPKNYQECTSLYAEACRKAVVDGEITINAKVSRSGIWINDAVEALFILMTASSHEQSIYHITSGEDIGEARMARLISDACPREVTVKDNTVNMRRVHRLEDNYFATEFQFRARFRLEECVGEIMQYIQKNVTLFNEQSETMTDVRKGTESLFRKVFPFIEAFVAFLLVLFLQKNFGDSSYFAKLDLFLLFVVLFSLVHGLYQAVFTGVLSMIGFFILNSGQSTTLELFMDMSTYIWIAQIFIVGMAVGYQHDGIKQLRDDKDEEIEYLDGRLEDIKEINESTTDIKNYFETQVINNRESLSFFYDIMTRLDNAEDAGILFDVVQVLQNAMGTHDVAIYESTGTGFYRLLTSTTSMAYELGRSLKSAEFSEIFDSAERDVVFVNTSTSNRLPSMVNFTRDEEGNPQMALFLWNLPFEKMTLQSRNMFRILTLLIRGALHRASRYMNALIDKRYYEGTQVLNRSSFEEVKRIYQDAQEKKLVEYVLIRVESDVPDVTESHQKMTTNFRSIDIVGYYGGNVYYTIAVNSGKQDAGIIINRLMNRGYRASVVEDILEADLLLEDKTEKSIVTAAKAVAEETKIPDGGFKAPSRRKSGLIMPIIGKSKPAAKQAEEEKSEVENREEEVQKQAAVAESTADEVAPVEDRVQLPSVDEVAIPAVVTTEAEEHSSETEEPADAAEAITEENEVSTSAEDETSASRAEVAELEENSSDMETPVVVPVVVPVVSEEEKVPPKKVKKVKRIAARVKVSPKSDSEMTAVVPSEEPEVIPEALVVPPVEPDQVSLPAEAMGTSENDSESTDTDLNVSADVSVPAQEPAEAVTEAPEGETIVVIPEVPEVPTEEIASENAADDAQNVEKSEPEVLTAPSVEQTSENTETPVTEAQNAVADRGVPSAGVRSEKAVDKRRNALGSQMIAFYSGKGKDRHGRKK